MPSHAPFHIHFSDIQFANRNETKHLRYGEGTLRADPLHEALACSDRPATVIGESPDEESNQAIKAVLGLWARPRGTCPAAAGLADGGRRNPSPPRWSQHRP